MIVPLQVALTVVAGLVAVRLVLDLAARLAKARTLRWITRCSWLSAWHRAR